VLCDVGGGCTCLTNGNSVCVYGRSVTKKRKSGCCVGKKTDRAMVVAVVSWGANTNVTKLTVRGH